MLVYRGRGSLTHMQSASLEKARFSIVDSVFRSHGWKRSRKGCWGHMEDEVTMRMGSREGCVIHFYGGSRDVVDLHCDVRISYGISEENKCMIIWDYNYTMTLTLSELTKLWYRLKTWVRIYCIYSAIHSQWCKIVFNIEVCVRIICLISRSCHSR